MTLAIFTVVTHAALVAIILGGVALWVRAQMPVPGFVTDLLARIGVRL